MSNQAMSIHPSPEWTGPSEASVVSVGPANRVEVAVAGGAPWDAVLAIPSYAPERGDRVLLARGESGASYVIGVLVALRAVEQVVRASDGARAELSSATSGLEGGESLAVRDPAGRLLFEYHPGEGRSVIHAPERDLEFRAEGRIDLLAGESVRVRGERQVELSAGRGANTEGAEAPASRVGLSTRGLEIEGPTLEAKANVAKAAFGEAHLVARAISTVSERSRHLAGLMEVRVTRLLEKARDVYREAEGLSQTRAGRLKLLADKTLHVFGQRAAVEAKDEVKIDADKIHIG